MPVPKPKKNEDQDAFISRCVSTLHDEDPDRPNEQIVAMCFTSWRESKNAAAEGGVELTFMAAVHSIASEGEHLATFYVMNTSLNRNGWRVTEEALEAALPSLLGKKLGCIPGYRVNHVHKPLDVGKWVRVEKPDGYALATAEITDPVAWERLSSGEWGPVSVVISAYRVVCSTCGEDITAEPCEHVKAKKAVEVVESFKFTRVDFVGTPAYPQAGIITLDELRGAQAARIRMASYSAFDKEAPWEQKTSQSTDGQAPGSLGGSPNPEEEKRKKMEAKIAELEQKLETLKTENTTLKAESTTLKTSFKAIEDERHAECVAAAVEARVKAGMMKAEDANSLKALNDETLKLLKADAEIVAKKLEAAPRKDPKTSYEDQTKEEDDTLKAAVDRSRERLFGKRKEADN